MAQADTIRATIAKKTIRAPFGGRLGIRQVNLGQILREGDPIVTLQSLDPIYVDFSLPQQELSRLHTGLPVRVTSDALPGLDDRRADHDHQPAGRRRYPQHPSCRRRCRTRKKSSVPGCSSPWRSDSRSGSKVLAIPATAVLYAPYGDSVFVVDDDKAGKGGKVLRQQFVRLGEKRGDFVAVTAGLKEGETVVSTGVFKLRNGQAVVVDNELAPEFRLAPKPENN